MPRAARSTSLLLLTGLAAGLLVGCSDEPLQPQGSGSAPDVTINGTVGYRKVTFDASATDASGVTALRYRTRLGGEAGAWTDWADSAAPALELEVPTGHGGVVADVEVMSVRGDSTGPTAAGTGTSEPVALTVRRGAVVDAGHRVLVTGEGLEDGAYTITYTVDCPAGVAASACQAPDDVTGATTDGRLTDRSAVYGGEGELGVTVRQENAAFESAQQVGGWS